MTDSMSPADVMALSNDGFGGSNAWFWIVVLFLFGAGGYGFGGNNQYATSNEVQAGFNNQNVMTRFDTLQTAQAANAMDNSNLIKDAQYTNLQNTYTLNNSISTGFAGINDAIMQSTFTTTQAMNDGFNGVQRGLCDISHQISDGVCAIKTQMLQDKYDSLLNEYNLSTMANANSVQTQNILSAIGSWYAKPPYAPYYVTSSGTVVG